MARRNDQKVLWIFFIIAFIQALAANFAHPITPTIIQNLGLNDYMFGVAFAGMAFTNFLFSPFWGKTGGYQPSRRLLFIGCAGYAVGQLLFCFAKTEATILFARCFSGFFVGAVNVSVLVYLVDLSAKEQLASNLTIFATIQSVGAAFGYCIGGLVGVWSITGTFFLQSSTLLLSGILFLIMLEPNRNRTFEQPDVKTFFKEANPFRTFFDSREFMTKTFFVLFMVVLFANLGTNAFDQCFNYYIKDQFGFTSAYNGILKGIIGLITLLANMTICMWIIKKTEVKKSTIAVLLLCGGSVIGLIIAQQMVVFILVCLVFFAFNAIYIPLLQDGVARDSSPDNSNMVMGFYNGMKSLGMIGGALIAGFIYSANPKSPFIFAGICFLVSAGLLLWNRWLAVVEKQKNK